MELTHKPRRRPMPVQQRTPATRPHDTLICVWVSHPLVSHRISVMVIDNVLLPGTPSSPPPPGYGGYGGYGYGGYGPYGPSPPPYGGYGRY